MKIALLGADSAAKMRLAHDLAAQFESLGRKVTIALDPAQAAQCDAILVLGLDRPSADEELQDARIRSALARDCLSFRVIYGSDRERLRNALAAIDASFAPRRAVRSWTWQCDKCSDPACEHRLFSGLAARD